MDAIQFFQGLDNLDIKKPENFKPWLDRLQILLQSRISDVNLAKSDDDKIKPNSPEINVFKMIHLKQALGPEGCEISKTVQDEMSATDKTSFEAVVKGLCAYFEPKKMYFTSAGFLWLGNRELGNLLSNL